MKQTRINTIVISTFFCLILSIPSVQAITLTLDQQCDDSTALTTGCYQTLDKLQERIWGVDGVFGLTSLTPDTLNPNASNPLTVTIASGTYTGTLACLAGVNEGFVTFRGNGRDSTILTSTGDVTVFITGCGNVHFQDLSITNYYSGGFDTPVYITTRGTGDTSWTNVNLISTHGVAWYEVTTIFSSSPGGCQPVNNVPYPSKQPEHFFFNSRIIGGIAPFVAACGKSWLYGSDVVLKTSSQAKLQLPMTTILSYGEGDVRLFGSTVRTDLTGGLPAQTNEVVGITLGNGPAINDGTLHMHGGIINVTTIDSVDAIGIDATQANTLAHTLDTAFVIKSGNNADSVRLRGTGKLMSPLLWQSGDMPPANGSLVSQTGKDIFVETDCSASSCSGGDQPHLMIYSESCGQSGGSAWFNTVTGQCRQ